MITMHYFGSANPTILDININIELEEGGPIPEWIIYGKYRRANGPRPDLLPNQHGGYNVDEQGNWFWIQSFLTYELAMLVEYNEAVGTRIVKFDDDYGVRRPLPPSFLGAPSVESMNTAITNAVAAQASKSASGTVLTDATGSFTYNYASKGYTTTPVVTLGLEADAGWVVTMSPPTLTSVSGKVTKPKSAVLGLLPYEAAGAGVKVHLRVGPAS